MFGNRRLAKRSIVGTRVAVPLQDGRYFPGVIQSIQTLSNGQDVYQVFLGGGQTQTYTEKDIIGPGFQTVGVLHLPPGQPVFVTHNGREVNGIVQRHDNHSDEVYISILSSQSEEITVTRKLEDVRLMESRKSARLQDHETDYSRMLDSQSESKKRTVSHVIDVPAVKHSRRRKPESDVEEMMWDDKESSEDIMDERTAAMVLTSLSCSPVSPQFPASFTERDTLSPRQTSDSLLASSVGSSGISVKSEPHTPSPPHALSTSAPVMQFSPLFGSPAIDEGIELDDTESYFQEDGGAKRRKPDTRTVFKCTWPGCKKIYNTCPGIEKHVRDIHLGPKDNDESDTSDHEEEFYYTEVEVTVDTMTETFADMYTSSPPEQNFIIQGSPQVAPSDHDYSNKIRHSSPQMIPENTSHSSSMIQPRSSYPLTMPVSIPQMSRSLSWQFPQPASPTTLSPNKRTGFMACGAKPHLVSSSPKGSPMHKKSRTDVKKCRKVYGMENRDLWCTQCKWKKACSRFQD